ncbi:ABC transporter permease [Gracilinema caldarium]|uniref:ABC transporter permease n=1 Tax=Gracilinema caldarium TaxID=215591 RepID=UPI0026EC28E8|nr:ABC transporter permease [Gracilinema caldarium]
MGKRRWIGFIALRYLSRSKKRRRSSASVSSMFTIIGIATGVFALIIVIGIMNGFQMGFIESILEISSFHLRIEKPLEESTEPWLSNPHIRSAITFSEFQALIRGTRKNQQVALVRGLPADAAGRDPAMIQALHLQAGSFAVDKTDSIILGTELARILGVRIGDPVSLASISGDLFGETRPELDTFVVTGIFRSNYYEFDSSWAFINMDRAIALQEGKGTVQLGVKLHDRWMDQQVQKELAKTNPDWSNRITTWREYNRSFFGALRTEKLTMFLLVGLIFVVVALNMYQSQRKSVLERREEIGLLRAMGASVPSIKTIFAINGFVVGFSGATLGMLPALWFANNIQMFFIMLEGLVNGFIGTANVIVTFISGNAIQFDQRITFFSPQVFYLKDIPCRLVPSEVLIIYLFGLLSATLASLWAAGPVSKLYPAEVLRYDQ